jgi:hypothetical protein
MTLLVIAACMFAGLVVHHHNVERRRWRVIPEVAS